MFDFISTDEINCGRQPELDIAKGLAICFMVLCHVVMILGSTHGDLLWILATDILGGPPAAPVFMTCLGIGVCYSRNSTAEKLAHRGIKTIGIGFLLNICRVVLPLIVCGAINGKILWKMLVVLALDGEILVFAGLAFLLIALIKKLNMTNYQITLVALIFTLFGGLFTKGNEFCCENDIKNILTGIILPANIYAADVKLFIEDGVQFPFLNWVIFPLAGLLFGGLLRRITDKKTLYRLIWPVTALSTSVFIYINYRYGIWALEKGSYYHTGLISALFYLGVVFFCFSSCYFLLDYIPEKITNVLNVMSSHILEIFFIHWVILNWTMCLGSYVFKLPKMSNAAAYIAALLIGIVSCKIAVWWKEWKKAYLIRRQNNA